MFNLQIIYRWLRPLFFLIDPERAHTFALEGLKFIYSPARVEKRRLQFKTKPMTVLGITFPNPIGLAAGLDKNGDYIDALFGLGFGFIEVGAVTPKPQPGNPKPRLFRLPKAQALINRLGFNNLGVDYLVEQLKRRQVKGIVGVNIGKNLTTSIENAYQDYEICLEKVYPLVDYVTVNISSPNTPELRRLQTPEYLNDLLFRLKNKQTSLAERYQKRVPLLLKIAPDLTAEEIAAVVQSALAHRIEGIVAVNTTRQRLGVEGLAHANEEGGLSGAPLFSLTLKTVKQIASLVAGQIPIIAVGGVMSDKEAAALFEAGADLIQIYTGLIFHGPGIVEKILGG